jgi:hypothetical protein
MMRALDRSWVFWAALAVASCAPMALRIAGVLS